jgi:hypothetical protein
VSVKTGPEAVAGAGEAETGETLDDQGRVPFRLRIGVTGHRNLSPDDAQLRQAVRDAIKLALSSIECPEDGPPHTPLRLTVVSALAEGADRIVAQEVLEPEGRQREGSKLVCVLPVAAKDLALYRNDFTSEGSKREFEELRKRAWLQLEPPREDAPKNNSEEQRDAGYLWAGQEVVRNCDVLIAIWDGQPSRGAGGTAALISWARKQDANRPRSEPAPAGRKGLAQRILTFFAQSGPPAVDETIFDGPGPLRIIVSASGDHKPALDRGPLWDAAADAKREQLKRDLRGLGKFNGKTYDPAVWARSAEQTSNDLASARYWQSQGLKDILRQISPPLIRADCAAIDAQRAFFHWSYAFFGCTALATIIAATQAVVLPGAWWLTFGELALIIFSFAIVLWENWWKNNNKHWFVYRFFAERLRTTCYLLVVGIVPTTEFDIGGTVDDPTRNEWVWRAFTAILAECDVRRQKPRADLETLSSLIGECWIGGQLNYFEGHSKSMMRKHNAVRGLLYGVLGLTIVAAALHSARIWPLQSGGTQTLVMCAIGLPAVAAALSNVRNIREFSRHSFRYARNAAVLRRYKARNEAIQDQHKGRPYDRSGIKDLQQLAAEVGSLLTAETRNWLVEVSERPLEQG